IRYDSTTDYNTVRLWDVASGQLEGALEGGSDWVTASALSPDGESLATGHADGAARVWDVASGQLKVAFPGHTDGVSATVFSPDSKTLAIESFPYDGTMGGEIVRLWDAASGQLKATLQTNAVHSRYANGPVFAPDGQTLATQSLDDLTVVYTAQL